MPKKQPSLNELEKLADFYIMDLYDLMDDKFENVVIPDRPIHGIHHTDVEPEDFESIAQMGKIIKNYQKMKRLEEV